MSLESAEPTTQRAIEIAFTAAASSANLLLLGPSGTGKSVLAREIHPRSPRRDGAFDERREVYSPAAGIITLAAMAEAGTVRFAVSDHGSGIPADSAARVFATF